MYNRLRNFHHQISPTLTEQLNVVSIHKDLIRCRHCCPCHTLEPPCVAGWWRGNVVGSCSITPSLCTFNKEEIVKGMLQGVVTVDDLRKAAVEPILKRFKYPYDFVSVCVCVYRDMIVTPHHNFHLIFHRIKASTYRFSQEFDSVRARSRYFKFSTSIF